MNRAYIGIGTNSGERKLNITKALEQIALNAGKILVKSSLYETAPWGNTNQEMFLNLVIYLETNLEPIELMDTLLRIEKNMGRVRKVKWESRLIDLDILFFNDAIVNEEEVCIPHPLLHKRLFVLQPLVEIATGFVHPLLNRPVEQLLLECEDNSSISQVKESDEL